MIRQDDKLSFLDFLSDDDFLQAVRNSQAGDNKALDALLVQYPDAATQIHKACELLCAIRPLDPKISDDAIARSLSYVSRAVRRRRVMRIVRWSAAAAVLIVSLAGTFVMRVQEQMLEQQVATIFGAESIISDSIVVSVDGRELLKLSEANFRTDPLGSELVINERQRIATGRIKSQMIHIAVPYGKQSLVELEDGTRVWIAPGSKVIYPVNFVNKVRELYTDGEVYLEVAHDADRPFVVRTEKLEVRVLGTHFNLNSSRTLNRAEVVLVEGKVEVVSKTGCREVLSPDQRYTEEAGIGVVDTVDTNYFTSWKNGYLRLDQGLLSDVLIRIARYYGVVLEYDETLGQRAYSGKLDLREEIEEVLMNLSMVESFSFERIDADKKTYCLTTQTP